MDQPHSLYIYFPRSFIRYCRWWHQIWPSSLRSAGFCSMPSYSRNIGESIDSPVWALNFFSSPLPVYCSLGGQYIHAHAMNDSWIYWELALSRMSCYSAFIYLSTSIVLSTGVPIFTGSVSITISSTCIDRSEHQSIHMYTHPHIHKYVHTYMHA